MDALRTFWNYPLISFGDGESILVSQLVLVLFVLSAGFLLSKLIEKLIQRRLAKTDIRPDAAHMLQRIVFYLLLAVLVITALGLMNVPLAAFAFVSGAVAIGVGFGAQNIINNFISGWILLVERPVRIDDFVEVDEHKGVVERIGNRSTRVRRTDGVHLLIPNSQMLERVVINWTLVDHEIRSFVRVGVAYGSPLRKVADLIMQAVSEQPAVLQQPNPTVYLEDYGDNAIVFDAVFWSEVGGERELRLIRSAIRFRLGELFDEHGIVIAFPQRDVHLDTLSPLQIQMLEPQSSKGK
ncbi:MAG: mechanosensitive ion channel domain-containing protein [Woeseiaceae bacterium]